MPNILLVGAHKGDKCVDEGQGTGRELIAENCIKLVRNKIS